MSIRKTPFITGEWYHCYSRGIDKRVTFLDTHDYQRFLESMFLTNRPQKLHMDSLCGALRQNVWNIPITTPLVAVGVYCLMPNHFHLLIKQNVENGISIFMQKLGTAYTMYFNKRYERSGGLFTRPFRAKHIDGDLYLQQIVRYIHLNPLDLLEEREAQGGALPSDYPFSSLPDYEGVLRPQAAIIDKDAFTFFKALP